jgi:hypothetical protein
MENLEARVGFEPTNGGFADLSLGPLGYRAELLSIAKLAHPLGFAASSRNCRRLQFKPKQRFARRGLSNDLTLGRPRAQLGRLISRLLFFVHQG